MRRRAFVAALVGAAAWPVVARGQQPAVPVIGYLAVVSSKGAEAITSAFHRGLSEAGYSDGRNVVIEYRFAEGQTDRLPSLAADLVSRQVTAIAAMAGSASALAAKAATPTIPIIFTMGDVDPVEVGLVSSLAHPGSNVTGVSFLGGLLGAKRLELLRELVPNVVAVGVLVNPNNQGSRSDARDLQAAVVSGQQRLVVVNAGPTDDLETAFATVAQQRIEALIVTADPIFTNRRAQLVALAARFAVPTIYQWGLFVSSGGLISYGADLADGFRQAGVYTGRVLKGEKPKDLPVLQPTKFVLTINLKTAKALGLEIPPQLLARADEIIE